MKSCLSISSTLVCLLAGSFFQDVSIAQQGLSRCSPQLPMRLWTDCYGRHEHPSGWTYVGEFKEGLRHGQGYYSSVEGDRFTGQWLQGDLSKGTYLWANGDKYVGEYRAGKRHGTGTFVFANGDSYIGDWQAGVFVKGAFRSGGDQTPDSVIDPASAGRVNPPGSDRQPGMDETRKASVKLAVSVSQPDANGVAVLSISISKEVSSLKVNGVEEGPKPEGTHSVARFVQVGQNNFEIVAVDQFGEVGRQSVRVIRLLEESVAQARPLNPLHVRANESGDSVAIIIGVEKYKRAPNAEFSSRDAKVFYDYARRGLGVKQENIKLLLDDKADSAEILAAIKNWLPSRVSRGTSHVYVFYSGHGLPSKDGGTLYFLPHEANQEMLERTAISQKEVFEAVADVVPRAATFFIDSCYSGLTRTGATLIPSARPLQVMPRQSFNIPSNFTVISASAPDQISSSSPELQHGIFSYYLMRGMEGEADLNKDRHITVLEMESFLSEHVLKRAKAMGRNQQPQVFGDKSKVLMVR